MCADLNLQADVFIYDKVDMKVVCLDVHEVCLCVYDFIAEGFM